MSGLARAAKKHWKRKFRDFKKYWKIAAIAVIAYFTFGLAAGAMPAAGAATGSAAAGAGAAATGAGVMTTTAAAATGTAAAVAGIETVTVTAAAAGGGISAAGAAGAIAGGVAAANTGGVSAAKPVQPQQQQAVQPEQPAKPGLIDKAKGAWKDMSFSDKLLLAKSGVDVVAAATAPSAEEEAAAAAKWQGAFYGRTASEADQFVKQQGQATQIGATPAAGKSREIVPATQPMTPGKPSAEQQSAMTPQQLKFQSTAEQPEQQAPQQQAEQVTNVGGNRDLFAQRAPGVRYLV